MKLKNINKRFVLTILSTIILMTLTSIIIYVYSIYFLFLHYEVMNVKITYIIGVILLFGIFKFWEKYIKRKLHFIIIGEDNKI